MIKRAASLFTDVLFRPDRAIAGQFRQDAPTGPAAILFIAYAAAGALVSSLLPPAFIPDVPAEAFGQSYAVYLGVELPAGLLLNVLVAAALPWGADFFAAGRAGPRVLLSIAALMIYLLSFVAAADAPALGVVLALAPLAAALAAFLSRRDKFPPYFRLLLAISAPGLALAPVELLAIAAGSKPLYEAAMVVSAFWAIWLLVRAIKSRDCPGTARAAAAAVLVILLFGGMFYGLALLLPGNIGPLLMLI
ncbi:MAG: hypothetical protein FD189_2389 [Elusimicrobia bacterium]|nr:MAG: hypothetical protein FD154_2055 [Elusimicrobiota bacterium]KAF0153369.1 MAG: hypothetical protein FD189_2389 [Elusimicrobiota bacterium]